MFSEVPVTTFTALDMTVNSSSHMPHRTPTQQHMPYKRHCKLTQSSHALSHQHHMHMPQHQYNVMLSILHQHHNPSPNTVSPLNIDVILDLEWTVPLPNFLLNWPLMADDI